MNNKKDNFNRISVKRMEKILELISKLTNLSNSSFYEYDSKQISRMFDTIEKEVKKTKELLLNSAADKNRTQL